MSGAAESTRDALLLDPGTRITCPKCEHEFSLEAGFAKKSLEAIEVASEQALASVRAGIASSVQARLEREARQRDEQSKGEMEALRKLVKERDEQHAVTLKEMRESEKKNAAAQLEQMKEMLAERDERLKGFAAQEQELTRKEQTLAQREQAIQDQIAREAKSQAELLAAKARAKFEEELAEKATKIRELQEQELVLRRERAKLDEDRQALELETQRRLDEQKREIEERIRAGESEKARLREAELQKTIDDMRSKLEEAQRKSEQGSQQLQGEVLELLLEEQLAQAFPLDEITEVKKGVRGGDAVHTVMTRSGQAAGIVLWEAKRAQRWSAQWPAKLKDDMREAGAVVGVVVTTSFPSEWPEAQLFGLYDGVWITSAAAAIPMATVLREGLLEAHKARVASANKGEKMEAVYDYLTSPQFAQKLKAVYDVFEHQRKELQSERTTTMQRWKRRERQIEQATVQLIGIAGDLQGLAQQDLPQLELEPAVLEAPEEELDEEGDATS
jgi:hypothetical protein